MASSPSDADSFFAALADMAEALRHSIIPLSAEERTEYVNWLAIESEIVFGVWPDPKGVGGFGFQLIKGQRHLPAITAFGVPDEIKITAIPCVGYEQAVAAKDVWGEPDLPSSQSQGSERAEGKQQGKEAEGETGEERQSEIPAGRGKPIRPPATSSRAS
jgi:hypothetical protein